MELFSDVQEVMQELGSWLHSHPVALYILLTVTPLTTLLLYASVVGYPLTDALNYGLFFGVACALIFFLLQKWSTIPAGS